MTKKMTNETVQDNETMAAILLGDNLKFEIAGWENELMDGNISEAEFDERMTADNLKIVANGIFSEAYKAGFLISEKDGRSLEAKHLNFLGTQLLEDIKSAAVTIAIIVNRRRK